MLFRSPSNPATRSWVPVWPLEDQERCVRAAWSDVPPPPPEIVTSASPLTSATDAPEKRTTRVSTLVDPSFTTIGCVLLGTGVSPQDKLNHLITRLVDLDSLYPGGLLYG